MAAAFTGRRWVPLSGGLDTVRSAGRSSANCHQAVVAPRPWSSRRGSAAVVQPPWLRCRGPAAVAPPLFLPSWLRCRGSASRAAAVARFRQIFHCITAFSLQSDHVPFGCITDDPSSRHPFLPQRPRTLREFWDSRPGDPSPRSEAKTIRTATATGCHSVTPDT